VSISVSKRSSRAILYGAGSVRI